MSGMNIDSLSSFFLIFFFLFYFPALFLCWDLIMIMIVNVNDYECKCWMRTFLLSYLKAWTFTVSSLYDINSRFLQVQLIRLMKFLFLSNWSIIIIFNISSVQFSHSVMSDTLWPHESQHAGPPCPSQTPWVHSKSCPLSWWCHPAISPSVIPFSSCPQSLPASESFPMSQLFAWGGQSNGVSASASVLPMNTQDWSHLGWTGWISLQSKGLSRVFSNTTVQKHPFFGTQLSL